MVSDCPKCTRTIPDDSVYCPYCGYGIKPSARSTQVSAGGTLMIVAAVASLIFFILSFQALLNIYNWYPPLVAQGWFIYDQMLTIFSFTGLVFGLSAAILTLTRKKLQGDSSLRGTLHAIRWWRLDYIHDHTTLEYGTILTLLFSASLCHILHWNYVNLFQEGGIQQQVQKMARERMKSYVQVN